MKLELKNRGIGQMVSFVVKVNQILFDFNLIISANAGHTEDRYIPILFF